MCSNNYKGVYSIAPYRRDGLVIVFRYRSPFQAGCFIKFEFGRRSTSADMRNSTAMLSVRLRWCLDDRRSLLLNRLGPIAGQPFTRIRDK